MKKYLEILWIWFWLTREEIKKVYQKKAMLYHPDVNKADDSEKLMMEINWAYDYIIENFNDYINKIEASKSTAIWLYNEWLVIFYNQQEYKIALSKFQKSIELDKNYYNSYIMIAKCMQELWDTDWAIKMYDKVIDMNNSFNLAYQNKAELLYTLWRTREADNTIKAYDKIKVSSADYYNVLVANLYNRLDYKSILDICEKLVNNKTKLVNYHWYKYKSLLWIWSKQEAYEYRIENLFKISLDNDTDNNRDDFEFYILWKGYMYLEKEMYNEALNVFSILKHVQKDPFKHIIWMWKAYIWLKFYTIADNMIDDTYDLLNSNSYKDLDKNYINEIRQDLKNIKIKCMMNRY